MEHTAITFEYEVPSVKEFAARITKTLQKYPYLVAEYEGRLIGYAYAGAFKERAAYDWSIETSVYVHEDMKRMGVGRALYAVLEECLRKQHILNVNACIAYPDQENDAYASSLGAALFSALSGYLLIPHLSFSSTASHLKALPDVVFELSIPQIMPVMSALVLAIMLGLASAWTKASLISSFLEEFQKIILAIVSRVIIPILPYFIGLTFCSLAYEGTITRQLPVFLQVIVIVLIGHFIWIALLYILAGIYSRENPLKVVKHYGPAYLTAIGTMSSAATLPVALQCAHRAKPLRKDLVDFGIPLFANIHLCGSVLTEVFFCMAISKILYGAVPAPGAMVLFCVLLGIFAIGAPGVPGGTVMASLGIITGILKFGDSATALMLTIFALQDSFGTACNVTGDGALTLILTGYARYHNIREQKLQ